MESGYSEFTQKCSLASCVACSKIGSSNGSHSDDDFRKLIPTNNYKKSYNRVRQHIWLLAGACSFGMITICSDCYELWI